MPYLYTPDYFPESYSWQWVLITCLAVTVCATAYFGFIVGFELGFGASAESACHGAACNDIVVQSQMQSANGSQQVIHNAFYE